MPVATVVTCGVRYFGWMRRGPRGKQSVARHREEDPRLAVLEHQQDGGQGDHGAERHDPARGRQARHLERTRERVGRLELLVGHEAGRHDADDDVDDRADGQPAKDADRHVALRVPGFFRRGGDRIEADVGKKDDRRPLVDARPAVRGERLVVRRVDVRGAEHDEEAEHEQLHDHHGVVGAGALAHADVEQPGDGQDDERRGDVEQDRDAHQARRGLQQPVDLRVRAEQRGPVAVRQPRRELDPEAGEQRREVAAPGNGDRDVADGVLEDEIPADDPGDQLAERRVGIGVGAARLRNHRRQLRVAQAGERADAAEEEERENERRAGAVADDVAVRQHLACRGGADRGEDPGADHRADGQHDEIAGAEHPLEAALLAGNLVSDRLARKELRHVARRVLAGIAADQAAAGGGRPRTFTLRR